MNERLRQLSQDIRVLTVEEQAQLMDELSVAMHDPEDAMIAKAWADDIQDRVAAVAQSEMETFDADDVVRAARRALKP